MPKKKTPPAEVIEDKYIPDSALATSPEEAEAHSKRESAEDDEERALAIRDERSDISADQMERNLAEVTKKTKLMETFIKDNLVEGTDYGKGDHKSDKLTLLKSGSEKVCLLLNLMPTFSQDMETLSLLDPGEKQQTIAFVCRLADRRSGTIVAEGRGACNIHKPGREGSKGPIDINRAVKMAEKRAQMDATLRAAALSGRFAQDLEDPEYQQPARSDSRTPMQKAADKFPEENTEELETKRRQVHAVWNEFCRIKGTDPKLVESSRHKAMEFFFKRPVKSLNDLSLVEVKQFAAQIQQWTEALKKPKEPSSEMPFVDGAEAAQDVFPGAKAVEEPKETKTPPSPGKEANSVSMEAGEIDGMKEWIAKAESLDELNEIWEEIKADQVRIKAAGEWIHLHQAYIKRRAALKKLD